MPALRQLGGGIFLAFLSLLIVIGSMSLALAEGYVPQPSATPFATETSLPLSEMGTASLTAALPSPTETATATPIPPTTCPPPAGWVLALILPGDTLDLLAARYHTSPAALIAANCLVSTNLLPGYGIYVPPVPTATPIPCGAPFGWIQYIVQPGDNLYQISQRYGVSVSQLQQANCLGYSTTIYVGQKLWVPNVITNTPPAPTATPINIEFDTLTPAPTNTPVPPPTATLEPPSATQPPPPSETLPPPPSETPPPPAP